MRWLALAALLVGCAADSGDLVPEDQHGAEDAVWPDHPLEQGRRYLRDRGYRRFVLEASIVDPGNGYSALRLANYARENIGWDAWLASNPGTRWVTSDDIGRPLERGELSPLAMPEAWTHEALVAAGKRAFEEFPLSIMPAYELALASRDDVDDYGLWVDDRGRVGGLVVAETRSGGFALATTCASCHGRVDEGVLVHGAASPTLDRGRLDYDYQVIDRPEMPPAPALLAWGPGHVDPTPDGEDNPTGIPDLRPVRYQNHFNAAATLRGGLMSLVVRTETLYITAGGPAPRPPREIAFAVAYYLWSLGAPAEAQPLRPQEARGRDYFELTCARCHRATGYTADPVPLAEVGTDPAVGESPFRGTGYYRIPSLFKVGDRQRLLHRSFLGGLDEMFDPERIDAVPGHPFGLDLTDDERDDLLAFVRTIGFR